MEEAISHEKEKIFSESKWAVYFGAIVLCGIVLLLFIAGVLFSPLELTVFNFNLTPFVSWLTGCKWYIGGLAMIGLAWRWQGLVKTNEINPRKDETLLYNAGINYKNGRKIG